METREIINRYINLNDFQKPEWKDIIYEMHTLMKVKKNKILEFSHCTDRKGFLHRAEIESYKHWEYPWIIKYANFKSASKIL